MTKQILCCCYCCCCAFSSFLSADNISICIFKWCWTIYRIFEECRFLGLVHLRLQIECLNKTISPSAPLLLSLHISTNINNRADNMDIERRRDEERERERWKWKTFPKSLSLFFSFRDIFYKVFAYPLKYFLSFSFMFRFGLFVRFRSISFGFGFVLFCSHIQTPSKS